MKLKTAAVRVLTARPDARLPHLGRAETDVLMTERQTRTAWGDTVLEKLSPRVLFPLIPQDEELLGHVINLTVQDSAAPPWCAGAVRARCGLLFAAVRSAGAG